MPKDQWSGDNNRLAGTIEGGRLLGGEFGRPDRGVIRSYSGNKSRMQLDIRGPPIVFGGGAGKGGGALVGGWKY